MADETGMRRISTSSHRSLSDHDAHEADSNNSGNQYTTSRRSPEPEQDTPSVLDGRTGIPSSPTAITSSSILSPESIDRVFPVRSAVSIDPRVTPQARSESGDGFPGLRLGGDSTIAARRENSHKKLARQPSVSDGSRAAFGQGSPQLRRVSIAENALPHIDTANALEAEDRRASDTPAASVLTRVDTHLANMLSETGSVKSEHDSSLHGGVSLGSRTPSIRNETEGLLTARFKHVVTDGGHAVITGREGDTLQRCEDEPIHIPGAVQSFGLLLALREDEGKLNVRVASENSASIIGYTPAQLFQLESFLNIFTEEQADNLLDHLDFIRDEDADVVVNGPEVFMLSIRPPHHRTRKLWCAMHIAETDKDLVICEFELEDDRDNPLTAADDVTPEPPEDTLGSNPTQEEFAESTTNVSKPLRVLRSARKKKGEAAAMEVFNIMSQVQEQLASAPNLQAFLKVLIGVVKELSGFHRAMIYQFDQAWNGRVVAELVDPRATKDLYKGLNFPASDIPKQARDLYKVNKVRLLYDRDQETSRLVCRTLEDLETPLDMTHAYLRAMSPIHVKYLRNMAVRASMSISITAFDELWGLIACHSYGSRGMRVSFPIRKMCRLVGDTASRNIERLSYASRLQARKLINTSSSAANPSGYIVASSDDLLKLFDADVGALSIRDETKVMGRTQGNLQEVLAVVEYLRMRKLTSVYTSQDIKMDFPDFRFAPGLTHLAGVLYVPLSNGGTDFIAFFRKGVRQEVKWAGNPYEKFIKEGTEGYLEPRKSFKLWSETIVGRCRDWTEEEIETASVLCLVYGKFIDVWRQKEAALQNSQLTRLLLANSAHEVRTPLNHIINYLEIALEGTLDQDTRDNLAKSHSASKSLVYVINDLLDLTKAEGGRELVKEEPFDFIATLKEAGDPYAGEVKRKGLEYQLHIAPETPALVMGDRRRVRQIVSNLISNAVQHTTSGFIRLEACGLPDITSQKCEIEIVVEDSGAGMSPAKVDILFRELEEVSLESEMPESRLLEPDLFRDGGDADRVTLGLGLAVVARTIRAMNGQLRLKTEEGKGSRFYIQLSFDIQSQEPNRAVGQPISRPSSSKASTPGHIDGEVTLVDRNTERRPDGHMVRRQSADSMNSLNSLRSGKSGKSAASNTSQRSDADRLITAIQEPLRFVEDPSSPRPESRGTRVKRTRSIGRDSSPGAPQKSNTLGSTRELASALHKKPGEEKIVDSGVPLRPVRVPEEGMEMPPEKYKPGKVLFAATPSVAEPSRPQAQASSPSMKEFAILVAEDDPVNSKIMEKRLQKLGHAPYMTVNGEECSSAFGNESNSFDAILMDLQMPIVDGFTATEMIRSLEKTQSCLSSRAMLNGRTPIFAVSASLVERERQRYVETGFDGWILKPVDFQRVDKLLRGIVNDEDRDTCLYEKGKWEQGGWFSKRTNQSHVSGTDKVATLTTAIADEEVDVQEARLRDSDTPEGSLTPTQAPHLPKSGTF